VNSLALHLVRLVGPGVPDLYQGSELWDLSLVDPDNRRPVDFAARIGLLAELPDLDAAAVLARVEEGLPKLLVTARALAVRARGLGPYRPLAADERHAVAYLRGDGVAVVVPRLPLRLARDGGWGDRTVSLPEGSWRHELTGGAVEGGERLLAELLDPFPVALLSRS
jgi:(1->4)-alpha-D-glucan 1-alpha-D-glucosylmutase